MRFHEFWGRRAFGFGLLAGIFLLFVRSQSGLTRLRLLALLFGGGLAAVHVFGEYAETSNFISHGRWVSIGSGVSVAWVFTHILPEIHEFVEKIKPRAMVALLVKQNIYLFALFGFIVFYALEEIAKRSHHQRESGESKATMGMFWLHIGAFSLYNGFAGYLLHHQKDILSLIFFFLAMMLHFFVIDDGLREHHQETYSNLGRWILAGAILLGTTLAFFVEIPQIVFSALFTILAGAILLNVIKEELPGEKESRFWAFVLGATLYAVLAIIGRLKI